MNLFDHAKALPPYIWLEQIVEDASFRYVTWYNGDMSQSIIQPVADSLSSARKVLTRTIRTTLSKHPDSTVSKREITYIPDATRGN